MLMVQSQLRNPTLAYIRIAGIVAALGVVVVLAVCALSPSHISYAV